MAVHIASLGTDMLMNPAAKKHIASFDTDRQLFNCAQTCIRSQPFCAILSHSDASRTILSYSAPYGPILIMVILNHSASFCIILYNSGPF